MWQSKGRLAIGHQVELQHQRPLGCKKAVLTPQCQITAGPATTAGPADPKKHVYAAWCNLASRCSEQACKVGMQHRAYSVRNSVSCAPRRQCFYHTQSIHRTGQSMVCLAAGGNMPCHQHTYQKTSPMAAIPCLGAHSSRP